MANFNAREFADIKKTAAFWSDQSDVTVKGKKPADLEAQVDAIEELNQDIDKLDTERKQLDGRRDRAFTDARDLKDRVRKAAVATLGSDAPELRKLGLKPRSERKRPVRKPRHG
ncbi:MAG: hypothetical protein HY906_28010 [Deltaproteobacteria bacterium]|nr:hypothetical protein [Deltaproteobacteria bacterium]